MTNEQINDALEPFQRAVYHQARLWDALSDMEDALNMDIESDEIHGVTSDIVDAADAHALTIDDLKDFIRDQLEQEVV